ncbi:MAG: hypothetical protein JNM94_03795 [Phycisphaerae bacterium]|nr:hypothetical protein [Phycisphaerae bacterium]
MIRVGTFKVSARDVGAAASRPLRTWWSRLPLGGKAKALVVGTLGIVLAIPVLAILLLGAVLLLIAGLGLVAGLAVGGWIRGVLGSLSGAKRDSMTARTNADGGDGRENVRVVR